MKQIALIVGKDLRRLRWALLLYWLLVIGGAWLDLRDPWSSELDTAVEGLRHAFGLLIPVTSIVMVGLLVHQDPLLGTSAYWMTRPIRPLALLAAKVVFVSLFLALAPSIADLVVLIRFGLEPPQWLGTLLTGFVAHGFALVGVAALAAVTPGIAVFLVTCIAVSFGALVLAAYAELWNAWGPETLWGGGFAMFCGVGVSFAVIWLQYHRYGTRLSRGVLAAGFLLCPLSLKLPWYEIQPSTEGSPLSITMSPGNPTGYYRIHAGAQEALVATWGLFNASADQFYELRHIWGKVRRDDGRDIVATCFLTNGVSVVYYGLALKAALPEYTWYGAPDASGQDAYLRLHTDGASGSVAGRTVSFQGQVQLQAYGFEQAGSLPAAAGARFERGSLTLGVKRVRKGPNDVVVDLQSSNIESDPFTADRVEFLLVRKGRREVARPRAPREGDLRELQADSARSISKPGGSVQLRHFTSLYPLPLEPETDRLEDLEIQVWRAVPREPYFGRIELPQLPTTRDPN